MEIWTQIAIALFTAIPVLGAVAAAFLKHRDTLRDLRAGVDEGLSNDVHIKLMLDDGRRKFENLELATRENATKVEHFEKNVFNAQNLVIQNLTDRVRILESKVLT